MTRKELISWFKKSAAMDPGAPSMTIPMRYVHAAHQTFQSAGEEIESMRQEITECDERQNEANKEAKYQVASKKEAVKRAESAVMRVLEIEKELKKAQNHIDYLSARSTESAAGAPLQDAEIARLKKELEESQETLKHAQDHIRYLTTSLEKKAAGWKSKAENTRLREELRIAQMSVEEKCRELHIQNCHICPVLSCCDNMSPAGKEWDEMKTENASLKKRLDIVQETYAKLKDELSKVTERLTKLTGVSDIDTSVTALWEQRNNAQKEAHNLKKVRVQRDNLRKLVDKLRGEAAQMRGDLGMRNAEIEKLREERNAALRDRNDACKDKGVLYSALKKHDAAVRKLPVEILKNWEDSFGCFHVAERNTLRKAFNKDAGGGRTGLARIADMCDELQNECNNLKKEIFLVKDECDKWHEQRNAEIGLLRTEGSSIVAERDKLKEELDKTASEGLALVALNEVYKKEIAEFKKELGKTRDCLSELVDDMDDYDTPIDSFTTQYARELLKGVPKQIDSCEETDHEKTLETLKRCAEEGLAEDQVAWNKAMSEVVRIPDMAKGLHSTTPLSTHGAGRDEMDHLKKAKPEETERTRKERAQLMREHYSRVARLADRANPHMMAAIDAWEKLPDLEKYLWKAEIDRDAAETERDCLKKTLKPLNQQVEEYGIALQKARQERQAAQCDRDNKTIELMEHKRELTEELMREFLTTLEPFALMHRFFAEEDDKHVLSFSEAAKITVGDLKRAKELRDKHFVNEESVPLDPDARTLTGQIEYGRGLADILLKKDFEIERLKKASKPLDKDDHKDEFLEVLKPFAGLYIPKSLLNDVGVCAVGDVKVTIDDIRKARELYDKHNVDEEETDHEKT